MDTNELPQCSSEETSIQAVSPSTHPSGLLDAFLHQPPRSQLPVLCQRRCSRQESAGNGGAAGPPRTQVGGRLGVDALGLHVELLVRLRSWPPRCLPGMAPDPSWLPGNCFPQGKRSMPPCDCRCHLAHCKMQALVQCLCRPIAEALQAGVTLWASLYEPWPRGAVVKSPKSLGPNGSGSSRCHPAPR